MKKIITKKVDTEVTADVICDLCHKSCKVSDNPVDFEYMTLSTHWGFFSNKDCQAWEAHLCEDCVDKHFGFINFKKCDYFTGKEIKSK